jgi:hypothetical protein
MSLYTLILVQRNACSLNKVVSAESYLGVVGNMETLNAIIFAATAGDHIILYYIMACQGYSMLCIII